MELVANRERVMDKSAEFGNTLPLLAAQSELRQVTPEQLEKNLLLKGRARFKPKLQNQCNAEMRKMMKLGIKRNLLRPSRLPTQQRTQQRTQR